MTSKIYLVFKCDGWGHSILCYCASTREKAIEWCLLQNPQAEVKTLSVDEIMVTSIGAGSKFYQIDTHTLDAEVE